MSSNDETNDTRALDKTESESESGDSDSLSEFYNLRHIALSYALASLVNINESLPEKDRTRKDITTVITNLSSNTDDPKYVMLVRQFNHLLDRRVNMFIKQLSSDMHSFQCIVRNNNKT